jgi:integrase
VEGLSKQQLLDLLAHAKTCSDRDWLMMLVHFWHGARASEMIHLTRENVQGTYLVFDRLKGSEACQQELVEHENPLLSERQPLLDLALNTPFREPLFKMHRSTYWRHVHSYARAVGVPSTSARTTVLKHTLGTLLIENMPINKVQRRMGHKNISSTAKYMKAREADVDSLVKSSTGL